MSIDPKGASGRHMHSAVGMVGRRQGGWNVAEGKRQAPLYLEDLHIGQRFTSATHLVDAGQIKAFAGQFDPQPFHLDKTAAEGTLFAGLAASGWHIAAITMKLLGGGGAPLAGSIIGAGAEVAWPRPTRPGNILQVESKVAEIVPSRSLGSRHDHSAQRDTQSAR
jgi:acyl dehydratase